jgi:methylaspartate ammonia-lyase
MGQRGEILQRFVRELQERISVLGSGSYVPYLYLALAGGYGEMAAVTHGELKSGPVLGNLWGLEQAAKPFPVLVEDPVALEAVDAQAIFLAQLRKFVEIRKMSLQLVSRAHAGTVAGITALTKAKAAHLIWLDGMQLGSLSRLVAAVQLCRDAGVGIVLGGRVNESAAAATTACQIALACRPDYLLVRPGQGTGIGFALMRRELLLAASNGGK